MMFACVLSLVWFFVTPLDSNQVPGSMELSRQEYCSGLTFPSPEDLPNPGTEPISLASPALAGSFFSMVPPGKPLIKFTNNENKLNTFIKNIWPINCQGMFNFKESNMLHFSSFVCCFSRILCSLSVPITGMSRTAHSSQGWDQGKGTCLDSFQ